MATVLQSIQEHHCLAHPIVGMVKITINLYRLLVGHLKMTIVGISPWYIVQTKTSAKFAILLFLVMEQALHEISNTSPTTNDRVHRETNNIRVLTWRSIREGISQCNRSIQHVHHLKTLPRETHRKLPTLLCWHIVQPPLPTLHLRSQ